MISLRVTIAALSILVVSVPLIGVNVATSTRTADTLARQSLTLQNEVAEHVATRLDAFVTARLNELRVLDRIELLHQADDAAATRALARLLGHQRVYQELRLVARDGKGIAFVSRTDASPPAADTVSARLARNLRSMDAGASEHVDSMRFDPSLHEPLLDIAVRIMNPRTGEFVAALAAIVRVKPIWNLLANLQLPDGTDVFITDNTGRILAHRDPAKVLSGERIALPDEQSEPSDVEAAREFTVSHAVRMGGADVHVVVTREAAAALALGRDNQTLIVQLTLLALVVAIVLSILVALYIARPVEQLADMAERISDGDYGLAPTGAGAPSEIQALGRALGEMTAQLAATIEQLEDAEFAERERAMVTLESIGDAVITTDLASAVTYLNPVAQEMTGWGMREALGEPLEHVFRIINENTREPALNPALETLAEGKIHGLANHTVLVRQDGHEYAIQDSSAPLRGRDGELIGAVIVFSDVTRARALQNEVTHRATHDSLTDLVNRQEFETRLKRVLSTVRNDDSTHALCFLDLDQFKIINDTCGHAAGDELLRQIANLFAARVRRRDSLARLGGDEFAVLMEHCELERAVAVAESLREGVEELKFPWDGHVFGVRVSIGVVAIDANSDSLSNVMRAADSACYLAKDGGRNRVHVYKEDDEALVQRRSEMNWASTLTQTIEEGRFELFAQPIVALVSPLADGSAPPRHFELLLRLVGEDGERISPAVFIPAAERYGLMTQIDRWVVSRVLQWLADGGAGAEPLLCAVNLSGTSLGDDSFLDFVLERFDATGVRGEQLCFEITETAAIGNFAMATRFINAVRRRGCKFALDDFGSGLSSFAYLKTLPVDILKIDGVFVKDITDDPLDLAMVRSINEVGHLLGMHTVAEFVETEDVLEQLREIGIDSAQGYFLGKPEPMIRLGGHSSSEAPRVVRS